MRKQRSKQNSTPRKTRNSIIVKVKNSNSALEDSDSSPDSSSSDDIIHKSSPIKSKGVIDKPKPAVEPPARKRYARRGRRRRAVSDHEMAESVKIQKTEETKEEAEKPPAEDTQKRKSKLTAYEEKTPNESFSNQQKESIPYNGWEKEQQVQKPMPTEQKMYYENPHREENYRYSKMHNPYYEAEMDQRASGYNMSKAEQEYYNMNPRNNYGYWNYEPIRSKRQDYINQMHHSQSMMMSRKPCFKFNVLPFELVLSESSLHMVSYNELAYLNSLAGKIQRISPDEVERIKMASRGDQDNMYFIPVKVARKIERSLSDEYRDMAHEYYQRPNTSMMRHSSIEAKQSFNHGRAQIMENGMAYPCHSESYSQDLGYKSHPRQLPIPKQY